MNKKDDILNLISIERDRQLSLPGSEWDLKNNPNDWVAISSHYLSDCVKRGGNLPDSIEFFENLVKAAAVIVAAIEYLPKMVENNNFRK